MSRGVCAAVALLLLLASPVASRADEVVYDGIAAQVGRDIVLLSEVNQMAAPVEERMRKAGAPESEIAKLRADVLDRLIEGRLLAEVVRRLELTASEAEIDDAIAGIARDTGLSVEQLERSVASHGLTMEEYRAKIREEIERSKVLNTMVRSRVRVEPEEVRQLYQKEYGDQPRGGVEVHLRHLLVAFGPQPDRSRKAACGRVADARTEITSGVAEFTQVAGQISDANPERGGDIGWVHEGQLASWMAPVVSSLEPGQVSEVVETSFGCNLLQLVERRSFDPVSFEDAQRTLEARIMRTKMEKAYSDWMETLRAQTYIERKGMFRQSSASGAD
jgi:peptidyl-prolyl cis-trans isomerase SurA